MGNNKSERKTLKKKIGEVKRFIQYFWHFHTLDKDMVATLCPDHDPKSGYPMSDEKAEARFKELNDELALLEDKLSKVRIQCQICGNKTAYMRVEHLKEISILGKKYEVDIPNYRSIYCELCEDGVVIPESAAEFERAAKEIIAQLNIKRTEI